MKNGSDWETENSPVSFGVGAIGGAVFATTISEEESDFPFPLSFSLSLSEELALPRINQLPCFLGIGRSLMGGLMVLDFGLGELPVMSHPQA